MTNERADRHTEPPPDGGSPDRPARPAPFRVVERAGVPEPVFDGDAPEAWFRAVFLRDTQDQALAVLDLIAQARSQGRPLPRDWYCGPFSWLGAEVALFVHARGVIVFARPGKEYRHVADIEIPVDEAEALLRAWARVVGTDGGCSRPE